MKKAIAAFLCIMLTTGMISGCAEREPESEAAQENTGAEESQETQDSQEEPEESQEETAEKEENARSQKVLEKRIRKPETRKTARIGI